MNARTRYRFYGVFLIALTMLLSACGPKEIVDWPELHGRVYDKATGKPLENAFVVANWEVHWAGTMGGGSSGCIHAEVVRTDAQGGYSIPAWSNHAETNRANEQAIHLTVYMPGYKREGDIFTLDEKPVSDIVMEAGSSLPRERLREVDSLARGVTCVPSSDAEEDHALKVITPVNEALFEEVCALDIGKRYMNDKRVVAEYLLYDLLRVTYGDEYARKHNKQGCAYEFQ